MLVECKRESKPFKAPTLEPPEANGEVRVRLISRVGGGGSMVSQDPEVSKSGQRRVGLESAAYITERIEVAA